MEKYILSLLKENSRVIIPEFGAFIIRQQNPPEIAFNGLLTFNDGILTEYVSHNSGVSFIEASARVAEYVERLKADLKLHNRLTFNEIGWIWTDDSGEKQFTPWKGGGRIQAETPSPMKDLGTILKEVELNEKSGIEIIPDSPVIPSGEQATFVLDDTLKDVDIDAAKDDMLNKSPDNSVPAGNIPAESFSLEESAISELEEFGQSELADSDKSELADHGKPELQNNIDPVLEKHDKSELQDYSKHRFEHPEKEVKRSETMHEWESIRSEPMKYSGKNKEKKKNHWILPVSIIGTIIILAGAAWLVFPDQIKNIISPDQQSYEEIIPEEDAINDPEINTAPVTTQASGKKYYVVAGCFKSQLNAAKYVAELRDKGFNAELFGTHDNLYAVSFNSFSSRKMAVDEMNRIRKSTEPRAWILFY